MKNTSPHNSNRHTTHNIKIDSGIVTKTLAKVTPSNYDIQRDHQGRLSREWFNTYKKFRELYPAAVEILEIKNNLVYTMREVKCIGNVYDWFEILDRENNVLSKNDGIRLLQCLSEAFNQSLEVSKTLEGDKYWVYDDLNLGQVLVTEIPYGTNLKKHEFTLVDPDSWRIECYDHLDLQHYYGSSFQALGTIRDNLNRIQSSIEEVANIKMFPHL